MVVLNKCVQKCISWNANFYAPAFRRRRHNVFGLSTHTSVRSMTEIRSFYPYMRWFVHPTSRDRFYIHPSVRPEWFSGNSRKTHERIWNGLQICMLLYPDNVQIWLDFGHSLLICLILVLFYWVKWVVLGISGLGLVYPSVVAENTLLQQWHNWMLHQWYT